jgi:hypothetical protein
MGKSVHFPTPMEINGSYVSNYLFLKCGSVCGFVSAIFHSDVPFAGLLGGGTSKIFNESHTHRVNDSRRKVNGQFPFL